MNTASLLESMEALAQRAGRSKTAQMAVCLDGIEAALRAGVTRLALVEAFAHNGVPMSLATFATNLKRLRARRTVRPQPAGPATRTAKQGAATMKEVSSAPSSAPNQHDPAELERISRDIPDLDRLARFANRKKL